MNEHEKINYVEFPAKYMESTKEFFTKIFGWTFTDYGPDYTAFSNQGIDGGFYRSDIFSFPGGRRFHFTDPNNNEFAVWSDINA